MAIPDPLNAACKATALDPIAELDRVLAAYALEHCPNEIRAISKTVDALGTQENKGSDSSADTGRAVDAFGYSTAPSNGTPSSPFTPRPAPPSLSQSVTPTALPANLAPHLAEHFRLHCPQMQANLATKKADQLAKIGKHGLHEKVLPAKRRLSKEDLLISYGVAAERMGGEFFTVRLGDREQQKVLRKAQALDWFLARLRRSLACAGLSNLAMTAALGIGSDGAVHVHGVLLPGARDLGGIGKALRAAAGHMPSIARARQLTMTPVFYGAGAIEYSLKQWNRKDHREERATLAATFPGQRLAHASTAMSRVARTLHEMSLPAIKPRRKRKSVTVGGSVLVTMPAPSNTLAAPAAAGASSETAA